MNGHHQTVGGGGGCPIGRPVQPRGGEGGAQEKITRFRSAKPTSVRVDTKPKMAKGKVKSSDKNKREEEGKGKTG